MFRIFRGIVIAITAFILITLVVTTAHAQTWSSTITTGLTSVESTFSDGTFIWTLSNNSTVPSVPETGYDFLVWSLMPFQVEEPLSWSAPEGWTWTGDRFTLADIIAPDGTTTSGESRKYYTPYSLAPGQKISFTYTPNIEGKLVNAKGPQPEELGFISHVAAVVPESGSLDGSIPWQQAFVEDYGATWYDQGVVRTTTGNEHPVPETQGLLALAMGFCGLVSLSRPRRHHPQRQFT